MNTTDKIDLNSNITYSSLNGTWESDHCIITPSWYRDYYYSAYHPIYTSHEHTEIAFKVAKMLQEKKLINLKTIKQFIDLVDGLIEVL